MVKVGVVGGTGYTGVELLRLLSRHSGVDLMAITSRGEAGTPVAEMFPSLRGRIGLKFVTPQEAALDRCDVVFFATPNGIAMQQAAELVAAGVRVYPLAELFSGGDDEPGLLQRLALGGPPSGLAGLDLPAGELPRQLTLRGPAAHEQHVPVPHDDLIGRLRRFLVDALPRDEAGLSAAARALGMSTRTLQRRVRERGVVYAGLVDDVRRHLSRKYLADGNLSLGEIAYLLGYSESSAFNRAYRRWTGRTPSAARRGAVL